MKKLFNCLSLLGLFLLISGCFNTSDDDLNLDDLPIEIDAYIRANYSGYRIDDIETERLCDGSVVWEVELEDGPGPDLELYFALDGTFLFALREISVRNLPAAVLAAIASEFPGYEIDDDDAERLEFPDGSFQYLVELEPRSGSDIDVIFDANGNVICREDDDDRDDDHNGNDGSSSVSAIITNYVRTNYPGYHIDDIETERLCDGSVVWEVELEDGPGPDLELYFALDGTFLFALREISVRNLPAAVLAAIASEFPGYEIDDDDAERLEFPDGSFQYLVELEPRSGSDIDVIFDANGNVICREDD